jgi:hypothetical protein
MWCGCRSWKMLEITIRTLLYYYYYSHHHHYIYMCIDITIIIIVIIVMIIIIIIIIIVSPQFLSRVENRNINLQDPTCR